MAENLKMVAAKAAGWKFSELLFQRFGTLFVGIVLARLLGPEEFGLVALLTIFISLADVVVNAGFPQALIQKRNTSLDEESSVFFCNILLGIFMYGVLYFIAPTLKYFYNKPELDLLSDLVRVAGLTVVIGSLGQVHRSLLQKNLRFKQLTYLSLAGLVSNGIIGITMAYNGYGVWALVISNVVSSVFVTALLWFISSWRPIYCLKFSVLKPLFDFGWRMLITNLANDFFNQINGLLIGRYYPTASLAYYNRGIAWPTLMADTVTSSMGAVLFPLLSKVNNDTRRMKRAVEKCLLGVTFMLWPALGGLFILSESLTRVILTEKWIDCVPYMQIMCLSMCLYPLQVINLQSLAAKGRADLFLRLTMIKRLLSVVILVIALPHGVIALVYAQLVISVISYPINAYYSSRMIEYSMFDQIKDLLPTAILTASMVLLVYFFNKVILLGDWEMIIICTCIGSLFYLSAAKIFRVSALKECTALAGNILKKSDRVVT